MSSNISVRADAKQEVAPEEATVLLALGIEGPDKASVHDKTAQLVAGVQAEVGRLRSAEHSPITKSSFGQLSTRSWRPYNKDGQQLPLVYAETMLVKVTFKDFKVLGDWVARLAPHEGVTLRSIQWDITDETRERVAREVRTTAVKQSKLKAQSYAEALGLTLGQAITIADAGLLQATSGQTNYGSTDRVGGVLSRSASKDTSASYELAPEDVVVSAYIEATFAAA